MNTSTNFSRREFLHHGAVATVAIAFGAGVVSNSEAAAGKKIPVGLQLYSIREQCQGDLPAMLAAVSKIGYKGVEFAGYYGRSAKELRRMLDDNGLVCCGTHTPYESVSPAKLQETIEFNQTLGNKFLIVPWMEGKSKEDWLAKAKQFNDLADQLKSKGMWIGYHAHAGDFKQFGGQTGWDLFFGNTKKEVIMQLDTSNCIEGGADPVAILKKYPRRARTVHIKASGGGPDAVVGEDKINWKEVFALCERQGQTQWYILEHESGKDPLEAVKRSFAALNKMGKV